MARISWKNRFILNLVKPFRSKISPPAIPEKIIVVSTTALGDTLWATPALASLRQSFPKAYIALLTSPIGKELFALDSTIDEILLMKEPLFPRFFPLLFKLRKKRFDTAIIFHASQRLILPLCSLSSIGRIIGTRGINKGLDELLTHPIEPRYEHEIERRLSLIEEIGAKKSSDTLSYTIAHEEKMSKEAQELRVAFHPGSKEPFRRWPPEHFAAVGNALIERFGCKIFLTGSRSEEPILQEIQKRLPSAEIVVTHSSVRKLAALLETMDLILSNDTGPFHLACSLNRPTLGLYVSTDPALCGPYKAPLARIISKKMTCTPCLKRSCLEPFCFLQIGPQEVIDHCTSMLQERSQSSLIS